VDELLAVCDLLGIVPVFTCKSPYSGFEAWWDEYEPGRCRNFVCVTDAPMSLVYSNASGLPGTWYDPGDYLFLDI